jgi:hypothetical protein
MTIRTLMRLALVIAPWLLIGCGDSGTTTTMPSNPPPIQTDAQGKPVPPPTAAPTVPAKGK